jgi:lipoyl(octanoyl) transferase
VPCGIADRPVGRLTQWLPGLTSAELAPRLLLAFANRFGLRLRPPNAPERLLG